jgi:hypothetical protein
VLVSNFLQHLWTDLWNCAFSFWTFQWDLVLLSAFHEKHFYCSNREQSSCIDLCQVLFSFCHQESHWHQHWLLVTMSYNVFLHCWHGISQPSWKMFFRAVWSLQWMQVSSLSCPTVGGSFWTYSQTLYIVPHQFYILNNGWSLPEWIFLSCQADKCL